MAIHEAGEAGMKIGFIGLGNIGMSLASNLIRDDFQSYVHGLNFEDALPLEATNFMIGDSIQIDHIVIETIF